jgi:hypothetical protein
MEAGLQRLAERRLLAALRRLHRREPMRPDFRTDAVLRELRADPAEGRPAGHRGGGSVAAVDDAALLAVVDALVEQGSITRTGRRLALAGHESGVRDPQMRGRVERLMAGLASAGATPPRVEAVAARLGIPPPIIDGLRASGGLVQVGEGIDYPADLLQALIERIDALARRHSITVAAVRDELRTSRRHAEALIAYRRRRPRSRAGGPPRTA